MNDFSLTSLKNQVADLLRNEPELGKTILDLMDRAYQRGRQDMVKEIQKNIESVAWKASGA